MTYLQFAFASFGHFVGCAFLFLATAYLLANVLLRLVYMLTIMLRGWPNNSNSQNISDLLP